MKAVDPLGELTLPEAWGMAHSYRPSDRITGFVERGGRYLGVSVVGPRQVRTWVVGAPDEALDWHLARFRDPEQWVEAVDNQPDPGGARSEVTP